MISPNEPGAGPERMQEPPPIPENPTVTDTANHFRVCGRGDGTIAVYGLSVKHLTKAQATNLAAWLVVMADPDLTEFKRVLAEIVKA